MSNDIIDDVVIEEPYGFIYITTNMCNGKRYLGQKRFDYKWPYYIGSGKVFQRAVEKYGKENFVRNIIDIAYSKEELNKKEYDYSIFFNVVASDDWYNMVVGGGVTYGQNPYANKTKEELQEINKKKSVALSGKNNPMYGKHHSNETKRKIGEAHMGLHQGENNYFYGVRMCGEENPFYGKRHTAESKRKMALNADNRDYNNPRATPIYCLELNEIFWGATCAEHKYNISHQAIAKCCKGKQKSAGRHPHTQEKLHWLYANDAISRGYITQQQLENYINHLKQERN